MKDELLKLLKLLKLVERYDNKIIWLEEQLDDKNYSHYKGIILGLEIAINDLMDVLNDIKLT